MMLSDRDIARELGYGELEVKPVNLDEQLQPCSLDIRLGYEIGQYEGPSNIVFDAKHTDVEKHLFDEIITERDGVIIDPQGFYLANTVEKVAIPDYLGVTLRGRSSIGRMGIEVHSTAGLLDAGFGRPDGATIVLEISNNSSHPVRLYPGMRIGQLVFKRLQTPAAEPYDEKEDAKYNDQQGAVGSRIREDHHND